MNMKGQVKRSIKVLRRSDREGVIPHEVLSFAQGIVFMTQVKGAYLLSGTIGSGIFLKRLGPNEWSPPASIGMASFGAGFQIGAQKTDVVIVLNDKSAVKAFEAHGQLKLGGDYAISAGPIGRTAKAELAVSGKGFSGCFSYSMSQGLFIGVSLEGTVLVTRSSDNRSFYNNKSAHLSSILAGQIPVPTEKDKRKNVAMLHCVLSNLCTGGVFEQGLDQIDSQLNLAELDTLDTEGPKPEGINTRDADDLVKKKRLEKEASSGPIATSGSSNASGSQQFAPTVPSGAADQAGQAAIAEGGKNLLVGALDGAGAASGWGGPTEDILGLADYTATPAPAPPVEATVLYGAPATATATATATAMPAASGGLHIAAATAGLGQVPLSYGSPRVVASRDHLVAEDSPEMLAHNIISLNRGDPCFLVDGTLEFGLPPPYADYVTVQRLADGRTGKISKYCLTPASGP